MEGGSNQCPDFILRQPREIPHAYPTRFDFRFFPGGDSAGESGSDGAAARIQYALGASRGRVIRRAFVDRRHERFGLVTGTALAWTRVKGEKILELAKQAGFLYKTQAPAEQRRLLDTVLSNCTFDSESLCPTMSPSICWPRATKLKIGGESGIRTLQGPLESVTSQNLQGAEK